MVGLKCMVTKDYEIHFKMTEEEYEELLEWYNNFRDSSVGIGGELSFVFTPTSLGEIVEAKLGKEIHCIREVD